MTRQMRVWQGRPPFSPGEKARAIEQQRSKATYFHLLGLQLLDLEPGYCKLQLPYKRDLTFEPGVVQGGFITTLADSCIAHAAIAALAGQHKITTSIELKINFIRPALGGTSYTAEAWLIHLGARTAVGEAEILNDQGKLIAKCLSSLMILDEAERADDAASQRAPGTERAP
jgi:uncharacterized protein (TIGR00369 family)